MITTDALRGAMHQIAAQKGEFTFFGLFMRANGLGWDLVVSAPWLDDRSLETLREFVGLLSEALGEDALRDFARVVTLNHDDPGLLAVISEFSVDDGEVRVQRSNLFGLDMEDAIIMRAKAA